MEHLQELELNLHTKRGLLVVSVVAAALAAAATGTAGSPAGRQLASFPGYAYSIGGGSGRVGWIDTAFLLHLRSLSSPKVSSLRYTRTVHELPNYPKWQRRLVVTGSGELIWSTSNPSQTFDYLDRILFIARGASTASTLLKISYNAGGGTEVAGMAGDASGFAYGEATVEPTTPDQAAYRVTGGGVFSVDTHGRTARIPDAPAAWVFARSAGRVLDGPFATDANESSALRPSGVVEVRNVADGSVLQSLSVAGVRAGALSKTEVALLVGRTLRRYRVSDGSLVGSTPLPPSTAPDLETDGTMVAARNPHAVLVVNLATGRLRTIAIPMPWHPTGVAVVSGSVVWSESRGKTPAYPSTKTFTTRILSTKLAGLR